MIFTLNHTGRFFLLLVACLWYKRGAIFSARVLLFYLLEIDYMYIFIYICGRHTFYISYDWTKRYRVDPIIRLPFRIGPSQKPGRIARIYIYIYIIFGCGCREKITLEICTMHWLNTGDHRDHASLCCCVNAKIVFESISLSCIFISVGDDPYIVSIALG